ncbi:Piso0_002387 [Millerozyma farinosa CBS 7064]|uniref:Piso0_002387 protein n=1 Tax=Pichia sorbitophila (strain ATCC MYA-4447 / BCRC 22081 / CBS 7064 / NBRC 10061 / NRRL Y-12695) TaxID=559304 RepID=G8YEX2_PICSO|nr:Piso0_002387 [Millerozyma farinosa CBS 7064]
MRVASRLLKHVPLIKFVGGPHKAEKVSSAVRAHPLAPNGEIPGKMSGSGRSFSSGPIELKEGEVASRSQLSKRFHYRAPKEDEIEQVLSGGAEVVF